MYKFILAVLFLLSSNTYGQNFFSRGNSSVKFKGLHDCSGSLKKWDIGESNVIRMEFQSTSGDTSIYFLQMDEIGNGWAVEGIDPSTKYLMKLKTCRSRVFISYNKKGFTIFPSFFPHEFELINTNDTIGVKRNGNGYFNYEKFSTTLISKRFSKVMSDTLYQYQVDGVRGVTHVSGMIGFLFGRKYGFLKLDYRLTNGNDKGCLGYKINSKFKQYVLSTLN